MAKWKRIKPLHRTKVWRRFKKQVKRAYQPQFRGWQLEYITNQYLQFIAVQIDETIATRGEKGLRITEIELITEEEAEKEKLYRCVWSSFMSPDIYVQEESKDRKTNASVNSTVGMFAGMFRDARQLGAGVQE